MSEVPSTPAGQPARPSALGAGTAHARLLAVLEALILSFLLRLPSRQRRLPGRGGDIPHTTLAAFAPDAPPHAPFVALGLVPDWILPHCPGRGMRSTPVLRPRTLARRTARAPPHLHRQMRRTPSIPRAITRASFHYEIRLFLNQRSQPAYRRPGNAIS